MVWVGLGWSGLVPQCIKTILGVVGLGWSGLVRVGLGWSELVSVGLGWSNLVASGFWAFLQMNMKKNRVH